MKEHKDIAHEFFVAKVDKSLSDANQKSCIYCGHYDWHHEPDGTCTYKECNLDGEWESCDCIELLVKGTEQVVSITAIKESFYKHKDREKLENLQDIVEGIILFLEQKEKINE